MIDGHKVGLMSGVKVRGVSKGQGIGHGFKWGRGQGWGSRSGSISGERSRFGGQGWGQDRDKGRGVKVRVMIGGHKVRDQGLWSRSGCRSWCQVKGGVKVRGPGRGLMFG